jgi:hypothetical protein
MKVTPDQNHTAQDVVCPQECALLTAEVRDKCPATNRDPAADDQPSRPSAVLWCSGTELAVEFESLSALGAWLDSRRLCDRRLV